jgi:hypothetical protein
LIESCVGHRGTGSLKLFSVQPDDEIGFIEGERAKKSRRVGLPHARVIDVRDTLAEKDPVGGMISLLEETRRHGKPGALTLIIGDWTHTTYDNFGVALAVEESEKQGGNTICCYREEGFWSLACEEIARVFELHQRVMFGSTTFEMQRL